MGASTNQKYLVIVESPNKCEKIKGYLDSVYPGQYEVMASAGHIRDLGKGGFEDLGYTVPDFKGIYAISEIKKNIDQVKDSVRDINPMKEVEDEFKGIKDSLTKVDHEANNTSSAKNKEEDSSSQLEEDYEGPVSHS